MSKILIKNQKNQTAVNIFILVIIAAISLPVPLIAADLESEIVLRNGVNSIVEVLKDPAFAGGADKERRKDILFSKADSFFDFNEIARGALGRNWQRFSAKQQAEFSKYFAHLIANTYLAKIDNENLNDLTINYLKTELVESTKSGIGRAEIQTEVIHNKVPTPVHYKMMKKKGGEWKIYDVKIEGVSLVGNYREQYRTRFNDSPDVIIREIKEKINQ